MRKKQEIMDSVVHTINDNPEDIDFEQKLRFLEVLIDIRDVLEDIKWKK